MRILVIGSGGREHALCWKLAQEAEVFCAPGNPGIAVSAQCLDIAITDFAAIVKAAKEHRIDLVVVGPEEPLINGLGDILRDAGIPCFGPDRIPAQLEGSKAYCKALMQHAGVPTAFYEVFTDAEAAKAHCRKAYADGFQLVIKASGNALGKGVIVAQTLEQALEGIDTLKAMGSAADTLVLEQLLPGREFSLLTLTNGTEIYSLPVAQDYKRIHDADQGPNTGGMGTFSPVDWVTAELVAQTEEQVVHPILAAFREQGIEYRGVLFSGLMQTPNGPMCLEYNIRFGDPETQSIMPLLGAGFANALMACAEGIAIPPIEVKENTTSVSIIAASEGYPGAYERDIPIQIGDLPNNTIIFHAGTKMVDGQLQTNGGRVLAVTATAPTKLEARANAYGALKQIQFKGMHSRTDIGA